MENENKQTQKDETANTEEAGLVDEQEEAEGQEFDQDENEKMPSKIEEDEDVQEEASIDSKEETIKQLKEELEQVKAEKDKIYDRMMRIQAEYENYKRRSLKERSEERKYKAQALATELLPVLDNFERALQVKQTEENKQLYEGISMIYNQFKQALATQGIEEIEAEDKPFDPNLHHAVMQVEDESKESNIVVEELQKGYMLKDRVIRPTMVKVNK